MIKGRRTVVLDEHIDVTVGSHLVARGGAEKRQPADAVSRLQFREMLRQRLENGGAVHRNALLPELPWTSSHIIQGRFAAI
jgi:hypothetical protein